MKNHSFISKKTREKKIELFKTIYIQEFLRNFRPEVIIRAISEKYLVPEQTIRDYIKPARLKKEIREGKYQFDENYQSIL